MEAAIRTARAHPRTAHLDFVVTWAPFQLDETLPERGENKMERYSKRFGAQRMLGMIDMMKKVGAALSPPVAFSYGGLVSNTIASHVVLEAALAEGGPALQDKVVEKFFSHYFEKEGNIGDRAALLAMAVDAGMAEAPVRALLAEGTSGAAVASALILKKEGAMKRKYRISGVPYFVGGECAHTSVHKCAQTLKLQSHTSPFSLCVNHVRRRRSSTTRWPFRAPRIRRHSCRSSPRLRTSEGGAAAGRSGCGTWASGAVHDPRASARTRCGSACGEKHFACGPFPRAAAVPAAFFNAHSIRSDRYGGAAIFVLAVLAHSSTCAASTATATAAAAAFDRRLDRGAREREQAKRYAHCRRNPHNKEELAGARVKLEALREA